MAAKFNDLIARLRNMVLAMVDGMDHHPGKTVGRVAPTSGIKLPIGP